ncbi:MAG: hypothetical protein LC734_02165 [Acidobacteria bacterium]|nr:hypothetical protein [Acidobacteriota bacterium]
MGYRKRNIACLESMWDRRIEDRLNVLPTLQLISKTQDAKFSHLTCNTREELRYNLNLLCRRSYGVLYFAFHGSPGKIHLHRDKVTLTELAAMMNHRFANWIIHFGTCSTLRKPSEVVYFVEQTGVSLVTGFTRDVDWIESSAFELLLFKAFHTYKSPRVICRHLFSKYADLAEMTGFKYFPDMNVFSLKEPNQPLALAAATRRKKRR